MPYEVQHMNLNGDWRNTWLYVAPDGRVRLETFDTHEEALLALNEHLEELEDEFHAGHTLRRYSPAEFRIEHVAETAIQPSYLTLAGGLQ